MLETCREFEFGAIKAILIPGNVSKFLVRDHLMSDGVKVDLNKGHSMRHQPRLILATLERKR